VTLHAIAPDLELHAAGAADLPFLADLAANPVVEPFLAPEAGTPEHLEAALAATQTEGSPSGLFVVRAATGEPSGGLALQQVSVRSRICQLTRLMVVPELRGSGVGSAAVRLACRHALVDHGFHRVQAETYGDNEPAQRLFERVGFAREGVRRRAYWRRGQWLDGVLFGLLAEELA
jgi:RimJ/RimL family protein N-acetyltransferase